MKDIKQVIIVRKDLNLRKTELASQVATASMGFLLENNESDRNDELNVKLSREEVMWLNGSFEKIIVVSVNNWVAFLHGDILIRAQFCTGNNVENRFWNHVFFKDIFIIVSRQGVYFMLPQISQWS